MSKGVRQKRECFVEKNEWCHFFSYEVKALHQYKHFVGWGRKPRITIETFER